MVAVKYFSAGFNRLVYGFVLGADAVSILSTEEVQLDPDEIAHTMIHTGEGEHEVRTGFVSRYDIEEEFCDRYRTDLHKKNK